MSPDYPLDYEPATPEYVLEVFRDWHRMAAAGHEADPHIVLTLDTPLREWEDALWIESWGRGGFKQAMNHTWEVRITPREWQEFEAADRTLGDLCRLIATRARRPLLRPWLRACGECRPAGAFLTIRSLLAGLGADPNRLTPSTPINAVLPDHLSALFWKLVRIAPGRLPPPVERRAYFGHYVLGGLAACWLLLGGILGPVILGLAATAEAAVGVAVGIGMIASAAGCGWLLWRVHRPAFVWAEWAEFRTFRDLAYALTGQEPRRRVQHSP